MFAVLSIVPFIAVLLVSCYILWLSVHPLLDVELEFNNTTQPTAKVGTVSYTTSAPIYSLATTVDNTGYTIIKPSTVFTTVFLGYSKGFDTSTFGPKPGTYITSNKPILFLGKPYNFRHLPRFLRPNPSWISGE